MSSPSQEDDNHDSSGSPPNNCIPNDGSGNRDEFVKMHMAQLSSTEQELQKRMDTVDRIAQEQISFFGQKYLQLLTNSPASHRMKQEQDVLKFLENEFCNRTNITMEMIRAFVQKPDLWEIFKPTREIELAQHSRILKKMFEDVKRLKEQHQQELQEALRQPCRQCSARASTIAPVAPFVTNRVAAPSLISLPTSASPMAFPMNQGNPYQAPPVIPSHFFFPPPPIPPRSAPTMYPPQQPYAHNHRCEPFQPYWNSLPNAYRSHQEWHSSTAQNYGGVGGVHTEQVKKKTCKLGRDERLLLRQLRLQHLEKQFLQEQQQQKQQQRQRVGSVHTGQVKKKKIHEERLALWKMKLKQQKRQQQQQQQQQQQPKQEPE